MIISDTAIENRISVAVLAVIIFLVGIYSYMALPRESAPDITIPYVFVSTSYRGVASEDIETSITIPIEKKLKNLDDVKEIHSVSAEGMSYISIEFLPGTDIDDVLQKVKNKVDEAQGDLPTDLENDPSVYEVNFSDMPIVVYSIAGAHSMRTLKKIADDLEDEIETITGVLEVEVTGTREREIRIEVDPDKLAYYRIPITAFQSVVPSENTNTTGGNVSLGDGRFQLRVPGEFETPEEVYGLVISTHNGRPIYLKDVATVVDGFKEETSRSRLDGRRSVNISVKKRSGENIIAIAETIDKLLAQQQKYWPADITVTKLMDEADQIRDMVIDLENNILSGLFLVVVVLLFSLGFRNALLVGLAIPFSMLTSFTVLYLLGVTLNMVVLFSLTLALGMLVDNAIVVVENVYRYMEQGVPRIRAAMAATSEVAYPVIGSTLTTVAAFFPMIFWPGIMGEFMKYLPITLVVTLSSSLFVAMVINPALTAFFMKLKHGGDNESQKPAKTVEEIAAEGEKPVAIEGTILTVYSNLMEKVLDNRIKMLFASFALLVIFFLTWMIAVGAERPVEFFPSIEPNNIYVNIDPPEGADLDYIDRIVRKVEIAISGVLGEHPEDRDNIPLDAYETAYTPKTHTMADGTPFDGPSDLENIEHVYATSARKSVGDIFSNLSAAHLGVQFIDLADRNRPTFEDVRQIRQRIKHIPGARINVKEEDMGPPTGAPVNIEISGDNYRVLGEIAREVRETISGLPAIEDVRDDYVESIPSIAITVDRQKASEFGLTTGTIGYALKTAYNGVNISTYREENEDYDISVRLPEAYRETTNVLRKLMIPAPDGTLVPLTTLAKISYTGSLGDITRIDHKRVITVTANVDETKVPGSVLRMQAEKLLADLDMPQGYDMNFTGESEEQEEAGRFLSKAFLIAIFLIFLILVTLFNSVSQPFIIMTSVILSLGGAFIGLTVINSPFSIIMTGVGIISLAGVVVNNAIVLIDYINKLRAGGMGLHEAVIAGGATRLRPVLLTAITTILGLIPMVTGVSFNFRELAFSFASESSQYWRSMAIVVIFGLMIATFLTLVVVPTLYSMLDNLPEKLKLQRS
ncbi:MAG: efflux RND transporter permease subunit [Thermodesulfobacteriota bacterium]|nr:efflux RND transporter permease subunit [Thermodesulfobacteriota bacterium]